MQRWCGAATGNNGVVQLQATMVWYGYLQQWCGTVWYGYMQRWCGAATGNNGVVQLQATMVWYGYFQQWCGTQLGLRLLTMVGYTAGATSTYVNGVELLNTEAMAFVSKSVLRGLL